MFRRGLLRARYLFVTVLILGLGCLSNPCSAYVEPEGLHPEDLVQIPVDYPLVLTTGESQDAFEGSAAWNAFLSEFGGAWSVRVDARTGLPSLAWGSGIPWLPGRGNSLAMDGQLDMEATRGLLEAQAITFIQAHPELFPVRVEDLRLNPYRSLPLADGEVWQVEFGYAPNGVKASGASIFFRLSHGNMVQFGTRHILPPAETRPEAVLNAGQALDRALDHMNMDPDRIAIEDPGTLYLLPQEGNSGALEYRLVWQTTFHVSGKIPRWTAIVDARTAELVAFYDSNSYACDPNLLAQGKVTGGVRPLTTLDDEDVRALPFVSVETPSGPIVTDFNGIYSYEGGESRSTLGGRWVSIQCVGCSNPADPILTDAVTGDLSFGTGGDNHIGNGTSTVADRTTFWHTTMARSLGARWIPDMPWFQGTLRGRTNIDSACNAYFDGRINFFRANGNCTNTGENPGVIQHEWGHGLHTQGLDYDGTLDPTPGFDGSFSEGVGDHVDWIMDHDPRIGPGFRTDGSPVRIVDSDLLGRVRTLSDSGCGAGGGYDGYAVHCGGQIWSQADWDLMEALVAKYGEYGGWYMIERLFYSAIPISETHVPNQPHSVYDSYALILDDDGDLANGVPDADLLNAAYLAHEIASDPNYADSGSICDPGPTGPAVAADPALDPSINQYQVQLSWPAVAGANFYNILRSELGPSHAFQYIARDVPAAQTSFVDDTVSNRRTYHYRIQVVDGNGCVSLNDNTVEAVVDLPELEMETWALSDDSGNGVLTPGEGADIPIQIRNLGGAAATAITAELVAMTPGVTVIENLASYPDSAAGESVSPAGAPFRIQVDDGDLLCGQTLQFRVLMSSDQGCWDASFSVLVGGSDSILEVANVLVDDFLTGNANSRIDPGEQVDLLVDLRNSGTVDSPGTVAELLSLTPGVTVIENLGDYATLSAGQTGGAVAPFRLEMDPGFRCGATVQLEIRMRSETGCWLGSATLQSGVFENRWLDDLEAGGTDWTSADPGDTATLGVWELADPEATNFQPEDDHTPGSGVLAWVTGAQAGPGGGSFDVDDGCTTLTSPVLDFSSYSDPYLSYWRWYVNETSLDDDFVVDISEDGGANWSNLETVGATRRPWEKAQFRLLDFVTELDQVRVRFRACDEGGGSITEALIDDLGIGEWICEAPVPRSEIVLQAWAARDNQLGDGDDNGLLEPGELIEVSLDLGNPRNLPAEEIAVTASSPLGEVIFYESGATAPDADPGATVSTDAPHLVFRLDPVGAPCFESVPLDLEILYTDANADPAGRSLLTRIEIPVGGLGDLEMRFLEDFEGPDDNGWVHAQNGGQDEWVRGAPLGQTEDPGAAVSGTNVWGTDLGDGTNGRYAANSDSYLESPALDLSGFGGAELRFQRWLTVEEGIYDQARIRVGGEVIWQNPPIGDLVDTEWNAMTLALPASTENQSGINLRFELVTDGGKQLGGWNIDDVELWASPRICNLYCTQPLVSDGVLRVLRNGTDVVLDWSRMDEPAPMNIYWSDDPAGVPPAVGPAPGGAAGYVNEWNLGSWDSLPQLTFIRTLSTGTCGDEETP